MFCGSFQLTKFGAASEAVLDLLRKLKHVRTAVDVIAAVLEANLCQSAEKTI
jgi:hypothetical protein